MADESFSNNPFKVLKGKKASLPEKGTAGRDVEKRLRRQRQAKKPVSPEDARDTELFLRAMDGVEPEKESGHAVKGKAQKEAPKRESFSFADQVDLKNVVPLADKKEKKGRRRHQKAGQGQEQKAEPEPAEEEQTMAEALGDDSNDPAFFKAMDGVTPLDGTGREVVPPTEPGGNPPEAGGNPLQDFIDGKLEFALTFTDEYSEGFVVGLDSVIMNKLRQGGYSPEASIDLHGLRVPQAFETLRGFFKASWYRGMRCVLVVPGRGHNSPDGIGILREKFKSWVTQEPFKRVVLAFCTAKNHDGGAGSFYVLLRKYKKKGHICWERMPADEDLM